MRLIDRMLARDAGFWEGMASGAAVYTTSYTPNREAPPPGLSNAAAQQYATSGVLFSALSARMALFSEATLKLQSVSDKRLFGNQSLTLLEHPWPGGTTGDLLSRMEQDASLYGNAFWHDSGDRLVRLRSDWCTIVSRLEPDSLGRPVRVPVAVYWEPPKTSPDAGEPQFYAWDEIVHWAPLPDPQASFRGMSWLTPVIRDMQADTAQTAYKIQYLSNAASPNLLIKYAQKLQPGTVDSLRERVQARYGGVDNAFKTLILDQGADATVIGNSLQQMDFSSVQQVGADRILAASQVPGVLVGLEPLRGAGRGYQESLVKFANLWARPQWRSVCAALAKFVPGIPEQGVRLWYDTSDIAALQDTETNQAQVALVRAQALLTMVQAGYTRDSAQSALTAADISQLVPDPAAVAGQPGQVQHMLPQPPGSGPGVAPLPEGSVPRLPAPVPGISPGSKGRQTVPSRRPAPVRRGLNGHGANGSG